jgi:hypothetical protein
MKRFRRLTPSPALVVASIALAVALGGTGYAAVKLPKNSVTTVQVKGLLAPVEGLQARPASARPAGPGAVACPGPGAGAAGARRPRRSCPAGPAGPRSTGPRAP